MKTSEFKTKVERMGFDVTNGTQHLTITRNGCMLAYISMELACIVENDYVEQQYITESQRRKLFSLIVPFAQTAIEERADE